MKKIVSHTVWFSKFLWVALIVNFLLFTVSAFAILFINVSWWYWPWVYMLVSMTLLAILYLHFESIRDIAEDIYFERKGCTV